MPNKPGVEPQEPQHRLGRIIERRLEGFLSPRKAAGTIVVVWAIGVVAFGITERLVDPDTFGNVWLGMWWAVQTVTTVGYGDVVPASTTGKVIATFLMLGGLSLFAVVTGAITSAFITQAQDRLRASQEKEEDSVAARLAEIASRLDAIDTELADSRGGRE